MESSLLGRNVDDRPRRPPAARLPLHGRRQLRDRDPLTCGSLVTGADGMLGQRVAARRASAPATTSTAPTCPSSTSPTRRPSATSSPTSARRGHPLRRLHRRRRRRGRRGRARCWSTATAAGNVAARRRGRRRASSSHVSTDYVFAGDDDRALRRVRPARPAVGAYGRTKLAGEHAVADAHADARDRPHRVAVRRRRQELRRHDAAPRRASATRSASSTDQVGCPTWTGHLAPALLEIAERRRPGIHHLAGAGTCSWHELRAWRSSARPASTAACCPSTSEDFPRPAPRPAWSVLGTERPTTPSPARRGRTHWPPISRSGRRA